MVAANIMAQTASVTPATGSNPITRFTVTYEGGRKFETQIWSAEGFNIDESNTGSLGVWGDCNPVVKEVDGKKCLQLTCGTDGYDYFKMELPHNDTGGDKFNLFGRRRLSLLYKPASGSNEFNAILQLVKNNGTSEENYDLKLGAWYDDEDCGWKRLYFNFRPYDVSDASHKTIDDTPNILVFKAKRGIGDETASSEGQIFYITDIKVEDEPYADGYTFNDWEKPSYSGTPLAWDTTNPKYHFYPQTANNGVVYLSGTWLKGENMVNPDLTAVNAKGVKPGDTEYNENANWTYEYNEYRDLSWFVDPSTIKYYVYHDQDSYMRWPDRGGLLGTNTDAEVKAGFPAMFVDNRNVLVFAKKPTSITDDTPSWEDTNVIQLSSDGSYTASVLEMADDYSFVNPVPFTVKEKIMVNRSMTEGFNTIIYPFSVTASEIQSSRVGTLYHHFGGSIVYFIPTTATTANTPFVTENFTPKLEEGVVNVTNTIQQFEGEREIASCSDTEIYSAADAATADPDYHTSERDALGYCLKGTYHRVSGSGKWGIATSGTYGSDYSQTFRKGGSNSYFKPFRAYLDIPSDGNTAKSASLPIFTTNVDVTSIDKQVVALPSGRQDVCTLSGVLIRKAVSAEELTNLPKGIYIINGKKQFVR